MSAPAFSKCQKCGKNIAFEFIEDVVPNCLECSAIDPGPTIPPMDGLHTGVKLKYAWCCHRCATYYEHDGNHTGYCPACVAMKPIPGVDTAIEELRMVIEAQRLIIEELRKPPMEFKPGCAGYGHNYEQRIPLIP